MVNKKESYIKYVTTFGRDLYFDRFLGLFNNVSYNDYESFVKWIDNNALIILQILDKYKDQIDSAEEKEEKKFKESFLATINYYNNKLPTLEEVSTYIGMFDES